MVAAGNSIGGFLVASLAADYKSLVQGKIRTFDPPWPHWRYQHPANVVPKTMDELPYKVPMNAGLVLINSAGLIRPKYKPEQNLTGNGAAPAFTLGPVVGPPAVLADAVSTALLFYLERTVAR